MFTLKTIIILGTVALALYCIRSVITLALQATGLGLVSQSKNWVKQFRADQRNGSIEAHVDLKPAS